MSVPLKHCLWKIYLHVPTSINIFHFTRIIYIISKSLSDTLVKRSIKTTDLSINECLSKILINSQVWPAAGWQGQDWGLVTDRINQIVRCQNERVSNFLSQFLEKWCLSNSLSSDNIASFLDCVKTCFGTLDTQEREALGNQSWTFLLFGS